jgi:hypothetical protein
MQVEELYCLLSEHPIYLERDLDEWSRAVQRKLGQIHVCTAGQGFDDDVPQALLAVGEAVPGLAEVDDQVDARSRLASVVDGVMGALAARQDGSDRVAYDTGILVTRISLCASVAAPADRGWWRRKSRYQKEISRLYRTELHRAAERLRDSVEHSELAPSLSSQVEALIELALGSSRFSETHQLAEQIMASGGFSSRGTLSMDGDA